MAYYIPPEGFTYGLPQLGTTVDINRYDFPQNDMLRMEHRMKSHLDSPMWNPNATQTDPTTNQVQIQKPEGFNFNKAQGYIDAITGIAKHATGMVADIRQSAQSQIQDPRFTDYNATGNALYDLRNVPLHKLSESNLTDVTGAQAAGDFHKKVGTGIMAGAKLGTQIAPGFGTVIGGIIGGVAGGAGSLANTFTKHKRYQRDLAETRRRNRQYTNNYIDTQNEIAYNMNTSMNNLIDRQRNGNIIAEGGKLNDMNYSDITTFNAGGTHEQNPNGGIQQGYGDNGKPNLVEEGEVLWNDFVFSNRIKPQKEILAQHNTGMNKDFDTYADMAKYIMELHKERESNPFDKQTLNVQMERLSQAQEYQKVAEEAAQYGLSAEEYMQYQQEANENNTYPDGGGIVYYIPNQNGNGTIKKPSEGEEIQSYWVPINLNRDGTRYAGTDYAGYYSWPNSIYSQVWNDLTNDDKQKFFTFYTETGGNNRFNPVTIDNKTYNWWNPNGDVNKLYTEATNDKWGAAHQLLIDWLFKNYYDKIVSPQVQQPVVVKEDKVEEKPKISVVTNPQKPNSYELWEYPNNNTSVKKQQPYYADILRLAPIFNNIRAIFAQNKPDYTYARQLASLYRPATYRETGQYQRYQPIDQHYLDTQAANQANTSYGFYRNNTAGNSALANLYATLAANNARATMNDAYTKSVSENNRQRNTALAYNNQIDAANEAARRQVETTNNANWTNIMQNAYTAAENERLSVEEAREHNYERLAKSLADFGKEQYDAWRTDVNPAYAFDHNFNWKNGEGIVWVPIQNTNNQISTNPNTTKQKRG